MQSSTRQNWNKIIFDLGLHSSPATVEVKRCEWRRRTLLDIDKYIGWLESQAEELRQIKEAETVREKE